MSTSRRYRHDSVLKVVIVLGLSAAAPLSVFADDQNHGVFSPDLSVLGRTYGDWSATWWQYMFSIPAATNPTNDTTGQFCQVRAWGPVGFLAGINSGQRVTRTCTVPARKPLLFPIINVECSTLEAAPFGCSDEAECRACAGSFADGIGQQTLKVTIDGESVRGPGNFRAQSPFFEFHLPANNISDLPPGDGSSVSDGYWVILKPLSPGTHVIDFEGAFTSGPGAGFSENVTYHLKVTE